jgi:hypothetical protein
MQMNNITDYSLLVGVHYVAVGSEKGKVPREESEVHEEFSECDGGKKENGKAEKKTFIRHITRFEEEDQMENCFRKV